MIDLSKIDLNTLTTEQLEKIKMILDLNQIQQSINTSQQQVAESLATVEKMRQDTERYERESRVQIEKLQAETAKLQKETKFFPWLAIAGAILASSVISGFLSAIISALMK